MPSATPEITSEDDHPKPQSNRIYFGGGKGPGLSRLHLILFAVGFALTGAFLLFHSFASQPGQPGWKTPDQAIRDGLRGKPAATLEVNLQYDAGASPEISINSANRKIGYVPKPVKVDKGWRIEEVNTKQKTTKKLAFAIPKQADGPPPIVFGAKEAEPPTPSSLEFTITMDWSDDTTELKLINPEDKVVESLSLDDIQLQNNKASYKTIHGSEAKKGFKKEKTSLLDRLLPSSKAYGVTSSTTLDIVFVGDQYTSTNLATFHNDVNNVITNLLNIEPYKSHASQLTFTYVDNTSSLGCAYNGRLLTCNDTLVAQRVNTAGAAYDQTIVLVNNAAYGGSGNFYTPISVAYNGQWGPNVAVHEFGHSFGKLLDEYNLYTTNGVFNGTTSYNCYAGAPPNSAWSSFSPSYYVGCNYPNWYRSSSCSLMLDITCYNFNVVSQRILTDALTSSTTPATADTTKPTVSISSPASGSTVNGTVTVNMSASDNVGVSRVELWKDGTLFQTDTSSPYTSTWTTTTSTNGSHNLFARAYDAAGNYGQSATTSVTVNNPVADTTPPTAIITYPTGGTVNGTVNLSTQVSDNSGTVWRVDFLVDGQIVRSNYSSPFSFAWDSSSATNAYHSLQIRAYDQSGNIGLSSVITVYVNNLVADTTQPIVNIDAPAAGATLSGTVAVITAATDNVSVSRVEVWKDGSLFQTQYSSPYTFSWTTTSSTNGPHSLFARAYDAAGNYGQSPTVSVTVSNPVADTTPPSAVITSPTGGTVSGIVNLGTQVSDDSGAINRVDLLVDGQVIGSSYSSPFGFSWDSRGVTNASHVLQIKGYDAAGNAGLSAAVTVSVSNVVPTQGPTLTILSPVNAEVLTGRTFMIRGAASDTQGVSTIMIFVDGVLKKTCSNTSNCSYKWSIKSVHGTHTIKLVATNILNVQSSSSVSISKL